MENPRRDQFIRIAMARLFTEYPFEPQRLAIASKMYSRWVDRKKKNKTKMRQERLRYSLWKCELCNDTFITDSKKRWSIVGCKCGKTSVDDEEWYSRYIGKPKLLQQSDKLKELNQSKDE